MTEKFANNREIVRITGLNKKYGDRVIFHDVNLSVHSGEMIGVSGPSGSGKSTLLNIIGMFEQADSGEIYLFGEKIPKADSKEGKALLKNRLFYLFQNFALVTNETVDYNLEIPLLESGVPKKKRIKLKMDALKAVGLDYLSLNEKIYHLSGGEQQRVALARGYIKKFDLLLADEPTGSLDEKNRDSIIAILDRFHDVGKTIIIVSHDPIIMRHCEKHVLISDHRIDK